MQAKPFSLNLKGTLLEAQRPLVMGILNATPDSFYAGSRTNTARAISERVEKLITDGADIIDVGAYSSRPGADFVSETQEMERLTLALGILRNVDSKIPVSVDTFRSGIARHAVEKLGADIINDISGGTLDRDMFETVAGLHVPYVLMHMRGNPQTMQQMCEYQHGVVAGVIAELSGKILRLEELGVADIIVDPGFGFSKTLAQNYELMAGLRTAIEMWQKPVLVGISRKSMITRALDITTENALPATCALNFAAIERGASILRVHDAAEARQAIELHELLTQHNN